MTANNFDGRATCLHFYPPRLRELDLETLRDNAERNQALASRFSDWMIDFVETERRRREAIDGEIREAELPQVDWRSWSEFDLSRGLMCSMALVHTIEESPACVEFVRELHRTFVLVASMALCRPHPPVMRNPC